MIQTPVKEQSSNNIRASEGKSGSDSFFSKLSHMCCVSMGPFVNPPGILKSVFVTHTVSASVYLLVSKALFKEYFHSLKLGGLLFLLLAY